MVYIYEKRKNLVNFKSKNNMYVILLVQNKSDIQGLRFFWVFFWDTTYIPDCANGQIT